MTTSTDTQPRLKLEQYLGIQIKRQRQAQELKIADVARIAGISQGMLSKIENAQVSTSLDTLSRLCDVLGMPMSKLFSQYDQQGSGALLVKAGEGMEVVRRGTEKGHTYHLLNHTRGPKKTFEAYMVDMGDATAGAHAQVVEDIDLLALAEIAAQMVGHPVLRNAPGDFFLCPAVKRIQLLQHHGGQQPL
jgi:transcriptional regulator with XRE-family HTH domain